MYYWSSFLNNSACHCLTLPFSLLTLYAGVSQLPNKDTNKLFLQCACLLIFLVEFFIHKVTDSSIFSTFPAEVLSSCAGNVKLE